MKGQRSATKLNYNDVERACAAIREAARRLEQRGVPLWAQEDLSVDALQEQYPNREFISVTDGAECIGGLILSRDMPSYWPSSIESAPAVYSCKLSILNAYVGQGRSFEIMRLVHEYARHQGAEVSRLDCDSTRVKLASLYEGMGFRLLAQGIVMDKYPTNFYEKNI